MHKIVMGMHEKTAEDGHDGLIQHAASCHECNYMKTNA